MMRPISAVINARLSSTRVPKKHIRPFANTTLIDIALEKLNQLDFFDNRYLAVADPELIAIGKRYPNVEVLVRDPKSIKAGVNPPTVSYAHFFEIPTEYIFILNPCQPLLSIVTIKKAYDYFQKTDYQSYTAGAATRDWIFNQSGDCLTRKDPSNYTTNVGEVFYKATHSFHIVSKSFFAESGLLWTYSQNDPHVIEITADDTVDVDTEHDFEIANIAYTLKQISEK
jgi:CMP-N-acetylneuraminic acid synthetase